MKLDLQQMYEFSSNSMNRCRRKNYTYYIYIYIIFFTYKYVNGSKLATATTM